MSYSAEEKYDVYDERRQRSRKARDCEACCETIRPGDLYYVIGIVYDGTAHSVKRCVKCQRIHEHLRHLGDSETWPREKLNCGEDYEEEWGRPPPEEIQALAFMTPDEAQSSLKVPPR